MPVTGGGVAVPQVDEYKRLSLSPLVPFSFSYGVDEIGREWESVHLQTRERFQSKQRRQQHLVTRVHGQLDVCAEQIQQTKEKPSPASSDVSCCHVCLDWNHTNLICSNWRFGAVKKLFVSGSSAAAATGRHRHDDSAVLLKKTSSVLSQIHLWPPHQVTNTWHRQPSNSRSNSVLAWNLGSDLTSDLPLLPSEQ